MRTRSRLLTALAAALALGGLAALPGETPAAGRPDVVIDAGRTFVIHDGPGGGGISFGLALLWPLEDHFRFGVMAYADGLGERTDRLIGPGGVDLGPTTGLHRSARGAVVRLEAHLPGQHALHPYVAAIWGVSRVEDDVRGDLLARSDATGSGLGAGVLRPLNKRHAVGVTVLSHLLARGGGGAGRYLSGVFEWRWSPGAGN